MESLEEIREVKREIDELSITTKNLIRESLSDLEKSLSLFKSQFGSYKTDLDALLSTSDELRKSHSALVEKIREQAEEVRRVDSLLAEQRDYFSLTEKDQQMVINNHIKQRTILKEIDALKVKTLSTDADEAAFAQNRIKTLAKELKAQRDAIEALDKSNENAYLYAIKLNSVQDDTLETIEQIRESHKGIAKDQTDIANSYEKGQRALAHQKKNLEVITKVAKELWSFAKGCANAWEEFNDVSFKSARAIGMNKEQAHNFQKAQMKHTMNLAAAYGVTNKEMAKFQDTYSSATGRAILLNEKEIESLAAMSKLAGEGVGNEVIDEMDRFGASVETSFANLAATQERAMKFGLNAQKSGELFAKNIKLASSHTFKQGINGVSKMTLLSQKLRFNLESVANAADKFSTIEGAIGSAANLQMLGGSYASQFGNPMTVMYEAMNDFESFTERLTDTFAGKGVFNKQTGQVDIGSMDKRFMKEAATNMGINYEEAINIAMSKVKFKEIESQINPSAGFSEANKTAISSLATWDEKNNQHVIKYINENGEEKETSVNAIDKKTLDFIQRQTLGEEELQKDVKDIAKVVTERYKDRAKGTTSWREAKTGIGEAVNAVKADGVDDVMKPMTDSVKSFFSKEGPLGGIWDFATKHTTTAVGAGALGGLTWMGAKYAMGNYGQGMLTKRMPTKPLGQGMGGSISKGFGNAVSSAKKVGGKVVSGTVKATKGLGKGIVSVGKSAISVGKSAISVGKRVVGKGTVKTAKSVGKGIVSVGKGTVKTVKSVGKGIVSVGKSVGKAAATATKSVGKAAATATKSVGKGISKVTKGVGSGVSKVAKGVGGKTKSVGGITKKITKFVGKNSAKLAKSKTGKIIIGGAALLGLMSASSSKDGYEANESIKAKEGGEKEITGNPILDELKLQTELLEGIDSSANKTKTTKSENKLTDTIESGAATGIIGLQAAGSKTGQKVLSTVGGKVGKSAASKAGSMVLSGGKALSRGSLAGAGFEIGNMVGKGLGYWDEGSTTDKLMNIGSNASTGAMIGSIIPGVGSIIGAGVGALYGVVTQYGDEIKDWAIGSDNMSKNDKSQLQYEETKFGVTDISDPQLEVKASLATVKMHDLLVSIWHHMNGKQSNGKEVDNGFFGDVGSALLAPFRIGSKIAKGVVNSVTSSPQEVSPRISSLNVSPMMENTNNGFNSVKSLPTVGNHTYISEHSLRQENNNTINIPDINLNISGTLKLTTDSKSVDVDIKKLLDNQQFKDSIIKMVKDGFDRNQGNGKINRNSISNQRVSSGYNKK